MRYLHTMVRISDVDASLRFYCDLLGLELAKTIENEKGRFTNYFLCTPSERERYEATRSPELELTYNWDPAGGILVISPIVSITFMTCAKD